MAEQKTTLEREYIIPLRSEWRKVSNYRRAGRAARAIKKFIAHHMKVPDRDTDFVKLDMYLNNEVWFRGKSKPPAKIKVKAVKNGDIVHVTLAEMPKHHAFAKKQHEKRHKAVDAPETKKEEKPVEKTAEEKSAEKEKEQAVSEHHEHQAKEAAKAQKHTSKVKEESYHRMALQK